jgi:hypothetical protein
MADFNRPAPPANNEPVRVAVAPRAPMTTAGPLFFEPGFCRRHRRCGDDVGPLAMAAFAVGRY